MEIYLLKNREGKYLCNDEDSLGGWEYSEVVDEDTVIFRDRVTAERESNGDEVIAIKVV